MDFTEIDQCKPVLLGLSLAGYLVKPLLSLYGTEWRERGYGLSSVSDKISSALTQCAIKSINRFCAN